MDCPKRPGIVCVQRTKMFPQKLLIAVILSLIVFIPHPSSLNSQIELDKPNLRQLVNQFSKHPKLTKAIISVESSWKTSAISSKGAVGLMQVCPSIWKNELKRKGIIARAEDLFCPVKNIQAGEYILNKYLWQTKGDLNKALKLYNGGGRNYARKVLSRREML